MSRHLVLIAAAVAALAGGCLVLEPLDEVNGTGSGGDSGSPSSGGTAGTSGGGAGGSSGGGTGGGSSGSGGVSGGTGGSPSGDTGGVSGGGTGGVSGGTGGGPSGGGSGGTGGSGGGTGGSGGTVPNGYVVTGSWHGYAWTVSDSGGSTISPNGFANVPPGNPLCVSGSLVPQPNYGAFGILGVNINQPVAGEPLSVVPTETGVTVRITNRTSHALRLHLVGADSTEWCAPIVGSGGFFPWSVFRRECWAAGGAAYAGEPLQSVKIMAPETGVPATFDFCLDSLAPGDTTGERSISINTCNVNVSACSPALIDDFEGWPSSIYDHDGRVGYWFTFNDGSPSPAQQTPSPFALDGPGYLSEKAARTTGSGFQVWGAGLGVNLNQARTPSASVTTKARPYDASKYSGISFRYRSNVPLRVVLNTTATRRPDSAYAEGGTCSLPEADCTGFHADLGAAAAWTAQVLPWSAITQPSWSPMPSVVLDPATLITIAFEVSQGTTFDVWVDDLRFY